MQAAQSVKKFVSRYNNESDIFWQKHQSDFSVSGLTRSVYCKKQAINYHRFGYWLKKLASPVSSSVNAKQTVPKHPSFLSVQIKSESKQADTVCSLILKNGCTLQIHDRQALSLILDKVMS